jgi:hypothetical protein
LGDGLDVGNWLGVARTETAIKLVAELAGEVLVVDELSTDKRGSSKGIDETIRSRNIDKVEGQGFEFKFVKELPKVRPNLERKALGNMRTIFQKMGTTYSLNGKGRRRLS